MSSSSLPHFPNVYTHRRVAETAAKACEICFKPSASVLVTPDKLDFFYVCPAHLKQASFCTPIVSSSDEKKKQEEEEAARKKKELDDEVARVKKEYQDRLERKKKEEKEKEKGDGKKDQEDEEEKKKEKKPKLPAPDEATTTTAATNKEEEEPRVFALHRTFYQGRLARKRQAELDKRSRERMENPNFFPSVPKGLP